MLDLAIAFMHTPDIPERVALHNAQLDAFDGGLDRVAWVRRYDDYPSESANNRNVWHNARRAWAGASNAGPAHAMILQDDMRPAAGFLDAVERVIAARPDDIIGLFAARNIQRKAFDRGDRWFVGNDGLYGGAVLMPSAVARDMLEWCASSIPLSYRWDDARILLYAYAHDRRVWFTAPSLVEHDGARVSTVGNSNPRRVASVFLPDVSDIDFSRIPDQPMSISGSTYRDEYEKIVGTLSHGATG
jgi:hypothetical protein